MPRRPLTANEEFVQTEIAREMVGKLRAFLAGELDHDALYQWTCEIWPASRGQIDLFRNADAETVFTALFNARDRLDDGSHVIRDVDVAGYLRWLQEGSLFVGDPDPILAFTFPIDRLETLTGQTAVRMPIHGLGWYSGLAFCAPATGRPFVALDALDPTRNWMEIYMRRGDDPTQAARELFEAFALDDEDAHVVDDRVELADLPAWDVIEAEKPTVTVGRYRSYAKAVAVIKREQLSVRRCELRPVGCSGAKDR